jgi:predicted Rdx family selenoprotein
MKVPARGLELKDEQRRDNGRGGYYLYQNAGTGLLFSVYLEPAGSCRTSQECREMVWKRPNPLIQDPVEVKRFEEGGFAVIQYVVPSVQGVRVDQLNLSAQAVRDGIWADVHLSKSGARQEDAALLRGFLRSMTISDKARRSAGVRSTERRFPLPGHGAVIMTVPPTWTDQVPRQSDDLATTIIFAPEIGGAFKVMVTPLWPKKKDAPLPSDGEIRANIDGSIASVRDRAAESSISVRRLKQGGIQGYYFSATDRAPKPGEFKFMTQGTVVCGSLVVAFTVLSNDRTGKIEKDALSMIGSMRHVW